MNTPSKVDETVKREPESREQQLINESGYDVKNGIITSPGKFEGEETFALHYYDHVMNGCSDSTVYDGDKPCELFTITEKDKREFPALEGYTSVSLIESDSGFIYCRTHEETIEQLENLFSNEEVEEE